MNPKLPHLMLFPGRQFSEEGYRNIHATLDAWFANPTPGLVFDFPCTVYQLIDGKWLPLHPPTADPNPDPSGAIIAGTE